MKKLNILLMGFMAMGLAACEDGPSVPPVQSNPQEPIFETENFIGEAVGPLKSGQVVALQSYIDAPAIEVYKVDTISGMPADATVALSFEMSNTEDFAKSQNLEVTITDGVGTINAYELNEAHQTLYGRSNKEKKVYYRMAAFLVINKTQFQVGGFNHYVVEGSYIETCMDNGFEIQDAYYLLCNATTWNLEEASNYKFAHSDADVYDDPVFTYVVEFTDDAIWWKIAPQSSLDNNTWDGVLGTETDGDSALDGTLVSENSQAGKIEGAGKYKFTINMEFMTYSIEKIVRPEFLCTPGGQNNWNQLNSQWLSWVDDFNYFCGAVMVNNDGFKMTDGDTWDDKSTWGIGSEEGLLAQPGNNIHVANPGLYWAIANLDNLTYNLQPVTSVGVVGDFNGWNEKSPEELTANADQSKWSGNVNLSGDWKIVINHNWKSNYGAGSFEVIVVNSPNNFSGVEGIYNITVDFSGNYPSILLTK